MIFLPGLKIFWALRTWIQSVLTSKVDWCIPVKCPENVCFLIQGLSCCSTRKHWFMPHFSRIWQTFHSLFITHVIIKQSFPIMLHLFTQLYWNITQTEHRCVKSSFTCFLSSWRTFSPSIRTVSKLKPAKILIKYWKLRLNLSGTSRSWLVLVLNKSLCGSG